MRSQLPGAFCVVLFLCVPAAWADKDAFDTPPTPRFSCPDYLARGRDANVQAFAQGERSHHTNPNVQNLEDRTREDLELGALVGAMKLKVRTSFGTLQLGWLLSNPSLDSSEIRERQAALRELRGNAKLRERVRQTLERFRTYEKRDSRWEKFVERAFAAIRLPFKHPERSVVKHFTEYNTKPHWLTDTGRVVRSGILPVWGASNAAQVAGGQWPGGWNFFFPMMLNYSQQRDARQALGQFKNLLVEATALRPDLLAASSLHLRELGEVFSAIDDRRHPLGFSSTARFVRRIWTNPILSRLMDASFLSNFSLTRSFFRVRAQLDRLLPFASALAELDVLLSFAERMDEDERYQLPEILAEDEPLTVRIEQGLHPLLALRPDTNVVPNDVSLRQGDPKETQLLFLTGLNARGKSTFVRMVALNILLAQIGAPVPAKHMAVTPLRFLTTMRRSDSTVSDESLFRSEAKRIAALLKEGDAHPRSLIFLDEVFQGTSAQEKIAAERALLEYLGARGRLVMIASHERKLTELEGVVPGFRNFHVSDDDESRFQVEPGPSRRRNAFAVLKEEGVPQALLDLAYLRYEGPAELDGTETGEVP